MKVGDKIYVIDRARKITFTGKVTSFNKLSVDCQIDDTLLSILKYGTEEPITFPRNNITDVIRTRKTFVHS
jgi:hypothetical protein